MFTINVVCPVAYRASRTSSSPVETLFPIQNGPSLVEVHGRLYLIEKFKSASSANQRCSAAFNLADDRKYVWIITPLLHRLDY